MPRSSARRNEIHEKLRHTLAFLLNHVLANHLAGLEMGVLVERFLLSQLNDLRVRLQNEIQLLVRDEEEGVEEDSSSSYSYSSCLLYTSPSPRDRG